MNRRNWSQTFALKRTVDFLIRSISVAAPLLLSLRSRLSQVFSLHFLLSCFFISFIVFSVFCLLVSTLELDQNHAGIDKLCISWMAIVLGPYRCLLLIKLFLLLSKHIHVKWGVRGVDHTYCNILQERLCVHSTTSLTTYFFQPYWCGDFKEMWGQIIRKMTPKTDLASHI